MRSIALTIILGLSAGVACSKKADDQPAPPVGKPLGNLLGKPAEAPVDEAATDDSAAKTVGVEPGGIARDANEGPAAVVTAASGTVEVRRVGEAAFKPTKVDDKLYPGDAVRTADKATATLALADTTTVELAEVSTVALATREGTADPASAAAVLAGIARFSVAQRSPGEGAFRVYTPAGVVITKGTVYGVGVAASGETRVGVESGTVQALGLANLDLPGATIEGGNSVTLKADGTVAAPDTWGTDDWGTWRDQADARIELAAAIDAHAQAMAALQADLDASYAALNTSADAVATFETSAAGWAKDNDSAAYTAALPAASADIDASFAIGGRLEALTWANAGHAQLASDIYVRHPDEVKVQWAPIAPRVDAAVLWPKRFEVTATGYLVPLRGAYYLHHPRGRVHAPLVGVDVPVFYAQVDPPELPRAEVSVAVWTPPRLEYSADAAVRPVWIDAPAPSWRSDVTIVAPAPPRANIAWYVRPPNLKANVFVGADVRGRFDSRLRIAAPEPRASLRARWTVPVGVKIKVGAPDLAAAGRARASFGVRAPDVRAKVRVAVPTPPRVEIRTPSVKVKAGAAAGIGGDVRGRAAVGVKVKAPSIRVVVPKPPPPPRIKVKAGVKVKAGFGIGN